MTKREPATHHIQQILQEILGLDNIEHMNVKLEHPLEEVDSTKFNRAHVEIDGLTYGVSVFKLPAVNGEGLKEEAPEIGEEVIKAVGTTFTSDYRTSNPKLHQLYVGWARETIQATTALCQTLWDQSRWPASDIATAAWEKLKEHIRTDAAWFEAAALEFMRDGEHIDSPRILVGDSLRNIPPGEYEGYIAERDGKLYFELSDDAQARGD